MSEVQKSRPTQKLFKYHIDRNLANDAQQSLYFYRLNRFRYNSYNYSQFFKWGRFKYPILAGLGCAIIFDYTSRNYQPIIAGH